MFNPFPKHDIPIYFISPPTLTLLLDYLQIRKFLLLYAWTGFKNLSSMKWHRKMILKKHLDLSFFRPLNDMAAEAIYNLYSSNSSACWICYLRWLPNLMRWFYSIIIWWRCLVYEQILIHAWRGWKHFLSRPFGNQRLLNHIWLVGN